MKLSRVWAMPNKNTFSIKPIKELISSYINQDVWIDPFARDSVFNVMCAHTNDLNADTDTTHTMEALEFLKLFDNASIDGVLFDPPYSPRQISECYKNVGKMVHMTDTQSSFYTLRKQEVVRILKPGGIAICCGWNSGGIGKTNGFELLEVLLVPHGGAHNDTIVTVEAKL
ncbi:MAG: adenine-specific DNA methylase [Gammaproteobacteria bacterium]|nr:adenine-specific DNA methylase [Gammaproteobacteria bacterium]